MGRKSNLTLLQSLVMPAIIILAGYLRLFQLSDFPPSLYWEEAALGYDAYSILKTGKDYHGNPFPVIAFPSFGDYKPSAYFYATAASIGLFGLNDFAIRFPSALSGIIAVYLTWAIARKLKLSHATSLMAALLLATMPWHIQFSRAAFEVNLGVTFFLAGILMFLDSVTKPSRLLLSAILFALSMYSYHGFRLLAPLMALGLFLMYRQSLNFRWILASALIAIAVTYPILVNINNPVVNQRFAETSFFSTSKAVEITNQAREIAGNTLFSRLIFHRYFWWAKELGANYLANFHPNFLFMTGDGNSRHQTGEFGPLYHWHILAALAAIGAVASFKSTKIYPVLMWLLLAPIPVMLTNTNPHTLRMLPAAPAVAIFFAYGLSFVVSKLKHVKVVITAIAGIAILEFFAFTHFYFSHYPKLAAGEWQYGYQQAVGYIESVKQNYQTIYFSRAHGRPSIYALLYGGYDPRAIQSQDEKIPKDQLELLAFDTYRFVDTLPAPDGMSLFVAAGSQPVPDTAKLLTTINYPGGEPAFIIYE